METKEEIKTEELIKKSKQHEQDGIDGAFKSMTESQKVWQQREDRHNAMIARNHKLDIY